MQDTNEVSLFDEKDSNEVSLFDETDSKEVSSFDETVIYNSFTHLLNNSYSKKKQAIHNRLREAKDIMLKSHMSLDFFKVSTISLALDALFASILYLRVIKPFSSPFKSL